MKCVVKISGRYLWRNREVTVEAIEAGRVIVKYEINSKSLLRSVKDDELVEIPEDPDFEANSFGRISSEEWEEGQKRAAELDNILKLKAGKSRAVKEAAKALNLSERQVWKLLTVFRENPTVTALLAVKCGRPADSRFLGDKRESIIALCIEQNYLKREKPSVAALHLVIQMECIKVGIKPPNYRTVNRRVKALDLRTALKRRDGAKVAGEVCDGVPGSVDVEKLLDRVEIDHTLVDVILRADTPDRRVLRRPWLTLAVDYRSRMPIGFYLSFERPSAASVAMCLAMAVLPKETFLEKMGVAGSWPVHGKPKMIWVDNALEFRSEALRRGCKQFGMHLCFRPVGVPRYGGTIERLIGTMMGHVHLLPGTTQSNVAQRGDYEAERRATMTLSEFIPWFTEQIVSQYALRVHRTLEIPPLRKWEDEVVACKLEAPRDALEFYASFLPGQHRNLTRVGVQIEKQRYWCEQFRPWVGQRRKVLVHFHRMDAARTYVRLPDGQICIADACNAASIGKSFIELRQRRQYNKAIGDDPAFLEQQRLGFERNKARLEHAIKETSAAMRAKTVEALPAPAPVSTAPKCLPSTTGTARAPLAVVELD